MYVREGAPQWELQVGRIADPGSRLFKRCWASPGQAALMPFAGEVQQ